MNPNDRLINKVEHENHKGASCLRLYTCFAISAFCAFSCFATNGGDGDDGEMGERGVRRSVVSVCLSMVEPCTRIDGQAWIYGLDMKGDAKVDIG